jgi:glycosyltransferase involved in cell wall biosynthesis
VAERLALHRAGGRREGGVWAYVPQALVVPMNRPLLRSAWVHRRWTALSLPDAARAVRRAGFAEVDLVYFDGASQIGWLDAVRARRSVFRLADNNSTVAERPAAAAMLERELARCVDAVCYTAHTLESHAAALGARRAFHLPNGVDYGRFATPAVEPPEYAALPRPRAVYVGALESWFDFDLLDAAAARFPSVTFVVIGPDHLARARLTRRPNLRLLGPRPHAALPGYLQHADVGLIPFDPAANPSLVHGINPLKLYEYLASGLPVVATAWDELRRLGSPAHLSDDRDGFLAGLERALAAPRDVAALRRYAAGMDWSGRVARLVEQLGVDTP